MLTLSGLAPVCNIQRCLVAAALISTWHHEAIAEEILIDNHEWIDRGSIAAPLVTVRPVTTTAGAIRLANTKITRDLIVRSATAFPEVTTKLQELGVKDVAEMPMIQFVDAVKESEYPGKYLFGAEHATALTDSEFTYPSTQSLYSPASYSTWDAKTLTNMVVTGVVDTNQSMTSEVNGKHIEWFKIDSKYARPIDGIYQQFMFIKGNNPPNDVGQIFISMKDDVTQYDALQKSLLENIGEITFGIPIVYKAGEKKLIVPDSVQKDHDVYWVDLAVTYRDIDAKDIAEMAFNVTVPEKALALKLIPLRYGTDVDIQEINRIPEMSVQYGEAKVNVGEYFSQTVSYKFLKPTIEGYGEGERKFSWKLTGEAVSAGSHRFAAILQVPKGTTNIDLTFSGHVRLRKSFIGEWFDGELIAGTDSWVLPVSF